MAIALVAHTSGRSSDGNGFTTGAIDTTGANFLIISISTAATGDTVSDSKGNTWTPLTENAGLFTDRWQRFFYAKNATTGSGHTFTVSGASSFPSAFILAFSGVDTTAPFDTENTANDFNNTVHAGSITPAGDNEVLIAALEYDDDSSDPTIDLSYTLSEVQRLDGGKAVGGAIAYLIQTTGATKNPAFSWTNGGRCVGGAAAFKAAAGGSNKTLVADAGSYAFTGTAVSVKVARKIVAGAGSYALSGTAVNFRRNIPIVAGGGSYAFNGTAVTLKRTHVLVASAGSYSLNGTDAAIVKVTAKTIAADSGSYTLSGTAVNLLHKIIMVAGAGSYTLNGTSASPLRGFKTVAGSGSYAFNGTAVTFLLKRLLIASGGTYRFNGSDVDILNSGAPVVISSEIIIKRRRRRR